jgi:hypothetical protein
MTIDQDGGLFMGGATDNSKGIGTINAKAVYDDGTILTDYVFEDNYSLLPVSEMVSFFETSKHLPTIPGRDEWEANGSFSVGKLGTHLWETIEVHARYIGELDNKVETLRKQLETANILPEG